MRRDRYGEKLLHFRAISAWLWSRSDLRLTKLLAKRKLERCHPSWHRSKHKPCRPKMPKDQRHDRRLWRYCA